jgi:hypothetical protein
VSETQVHGVHIRRATAKWSAGLSCKLAEGRSGRDATEAAQHWTSTYTHLYRNMQQKYEKHTFVGEGRKNTLLQQVPSST